ncbi:MAG: hypothetical protein HZA93_23850 [Verrucomicrobia bacterium]|nr:hypothetical protein [Verrucomicrobiota bacterium]
MMQVKTSVTDRATPILVAIEESIRPDRLKPVVGRAAVNVVRRHFFALDRERPNALAGGRTHYYAGAARGTHFDVLPDGVMISVNQVGILQRILGGTIVPKQAKFLTIPARSEAYGKRASEFRDLIILRRGDHQFGEPYALARAVSTIVHRSGAADSLLLGGSRSSSGGLQGGEILFWLKRSVTQAPDPTVAPDTLALYAGIKLATNEVIARHVARARERGARTQNPGPRTPP